MPLTRREFEIAAVRLWPQAGADLDRIRQRIDWLFGLSHATLIGTPQSDDADLLVRVLEVRAALPAHHRLLAAFPRPIAQEATA